MSNVTETDVDGSSWIQFEVLLQYLSGGTEENHEEPQ
jgi:hypothetical protein